MKKLLLIIGIAAVAVVTNAQTNTMPVFKYIELLSATNSDWTFALAPSYSSDLEDNTDATTPWGASFLAGYWVVPNVLTGVRLDYFNGDFFSAQAAVTVQQPIKLFSKVTVIPFVTTAIATPITGAHSDNGEPAYIAGAGMAARLITKGSWSLDALYEVEQWVGVLNDPVVNHLGVVANFKF